MLIALLKISRNPENTAAVFDLAEALYKMGSSEAVRKKFQQDPDCFEIIKNRTLLKPINLTELQTLPLGTIGRAYADHMIGNKLDPNFYRVLEIKNDTIFVMMRMRQTHDLWHVLTGFNTSVPGEIGLQAFMAAQISAPLSILLMAGALFKVATKQQESLDVVMNSITQGWLMGKKAKPFFSIDWEANWKTPVLELRSAYQVEASDQLVIAGL